jgi:ABC-type phosphate transport system substrate-binding protein
MNRMASSDRLIIPRRTALLSVAAVGASWWPETASAGTGIVVVINPANGEAPSLSDIAAIFTTRRQTWKNGERIVPFNFPPRHEVRAAFDQAALGMDADTVARYWIDRKIRGGNPPPKQVNNGQLIVRLVAKMPGAIGYVPRDLASSAVKVVSEV